MIFFYIFDVLSANKHGWMDGWIV